MANYVADGLVLVSKTTTSDGQSWATGKQIHASVVQIYTLDAQDSPQEVQAAAIAAAEAEGWEINPDLGNDMGFVHLVREFDWGNAYLTVALDDDPGEDARLLLFLDE